MVYLNKPGFRSYQKGQIYKLALSFLFLFVLPTEQASAKKSTSKRKSISVAESKDDQHGVPPPPEVGRFYVAWGASHPRLRYLGIDMFGGMKITQEFDIELLARATPFQSPSAEDRGYSHEKINDLGTRLNWSSLPWLKFGFLTTFRTSSFTSSRISQQYIETGEFEIAGLKRISTVRGVYMGPVISSTWTRSSRDFIGIDWVSIQYCITHKMTSSETRVTNGDLAPDLKPTFNDFKEFARRKSTEPQLQIGPIFYGLRF